MERYTAIKTTQDSRFETIFFMPEVLNCNKQLATMYMGQQSRAAEPRNGSLPRRVGYERYGVT